MIQTKLALTGAWVALVVITVLSLTVADSSGIGATVETALVVAAAAAKGRVILVWFMGARSFPLSWRLFFGAWLLFNAVVIIGFHLIGQA
jgi:hypothetical protein